MSMDEALNKAKDLIFAGYESVNNEAIYRLVLEDGSIYFPFVRQEYINYYKNRYFYKENKKISLIVSYGEKKDNIQLILKNEKNIKGKSGKKYFTLIF